MKKNILSLVLLIVIGVPSVIYSFTLKPVEGTGGGGGGLNNVVEDLTPQAGGNFDFQNFDLLLSDTSFTNQGGILKKGGFAFFHNFNYGNNGTVTTDGKNIFLGKSSGNFTMGSSANAVDQASNNVAVGENTLTNNTLGRSNVALGYNALVNNLTGDYNVALGRNTLALSTIGDNNVAVGMQSGVFISTGQNNTLMGYDSMGSGTTASNNVVLGMSSFYENSSGSDNTIVGYNTGRGIMFGNANTIIGANVSGLIPPLSNNIIIADGSGNIRIQVDSSGNVGIGTTVPLTTLEVTGTLSYTTTATLNITAAGGISITRTVTRVQGNGGAVDITAIPQIGAGSPEQIIFLKGMSDTNTLKLDDGDGLAMAGNVSFVMGKGDIISFLYDATDLTYYELSRSDN